MRIERGIYRRGDTLWLRYSDGSGREIRESTGSDNLTVARRRLKEALGKVAAGLPVAPVQNKVRLGNLVGDYLLDYSINGKRSAFAAEARVKHLLAYFGETRRAIDITPETVAKYVAHRQAEKASNSTINRETSSLGRMFRLAIQKGKLHHVPHVPRLREPPPRQGFFEHHEYAAVREELPDYLKDVLDFGYNSGWRKMEILKLRWEDLDFQANLIHLRPENSKTSEPRILPLSDPLREVIERRWKLRSPVCPFVFSRSGKEIKNFDVAWKKACEAAGLAGKLFHDCRRTVARNLVRSGVPEGIAMRITGHKTRSVFERYNIVTEDDLRKATENLTAYVKKQDPSNVKPFRLEAGA